MGFECADGPFRSIAPVYMGWDKLIINVVACEILSQQWCSFVVESVYSRFKSTGS